MSTSRYGHCETYEVPCREGQHREFYWLEALTSCRSGGGAKSQDVEKEMCVHLEGWKGTHGGIKRLCVIAFYENVCVCVGSWQPMRINAK